MIASLRKLFGKRKPLKLTTNLREKYSADYVLDEDKHPVSIAEYNYTHGANYSLNQVYGNGYEEALTEYDKLSITHFCQNGYLLRLDNESRETNPNLSAKAIAHGMLSGNFDLLQSKLRNDSELILHNNKTIKGVQDIVEYWKGWRDRFVVTKEITEFKIIQSNYYSDSALEMKTMVVLFLCNEDY